jgi:glycosyltransferase involved in cell wall biosynthesis
MRVLFVVPYAPNLVRVRPLQLITHLARRGHDLTIATLWTDDDEEADLRGLQALGARVVARPLSPLRSASNCLAAVPSKTPLQAVYCWHPGLAAELVTQHATGQIPPYDIVHVEHLRGAHYGLWLKRQMAGRSPAAQPPVVWDAVDCISHLFSQAARQSRSLKGRLMTRFELGRTQRYEGWLVGQFDHVTVTSPVDQQALATLWQEHSAGRHLPGAGSAANRLTVLPNGVDLDYFTPDATPRGPATVVLSGKMSYHANVSAALHLVHDIMPRVWSVQPEVRVVIAGKDPAQQIRQLALQHPDRVEVTGAVPDIRPYLRQATVAVAPMLYSAGIQNKVLEAMACGAPVIANQPAVSALAVRPGTDLLIAGNAADFAAEILALLANPAAQREIGQAGRAYVERCHSWHAVASQLETVYTSASEARRARVGIHSLSGLGNWPEATPQAGSAGPSGVLHKGQPKRELLS